MTTIFGFSKGEDNMKKAKGVIKIKHGVGVNTLLLALAGKVMIDSFIKFDKWAKEDELAEMTKQTLAAFEKLQEQLDKFEVKPESESVDE